MDVRRILVILLGLVYVNCLESVPQKACLGTSTGMSHSISLQNYAFYKDKYENCTIVQGNLELVWLLEQDYNLGFLRYIQEVTGYVLILGVASRKVPLSSLRIIRGKDQFYHEGKYFSLYVGLNYKKGTTRGLMELQLPSLHEILSGDVYFHDNPYLCHVNRDVNWVDILSGKGAHFDSEKTPAAHVSCGACDVSCNGTKDSGGNYRRHCWGTERKMCQRLTKLPCSPQCDSRCYGLTPRECCHPECAGGCTGPSMKECWACKNFNNDGECVPFCPGQTIYDQKTYKMVPNPKAKYTYDTLCVKECPKNLVHDQGACVEHCGAGRKSQANAKKQIHCVKCDGPCPKACNGTAPGGWVNSNNIHTFTNCTYIKGNIRILAISFVEDRFENASAMEPKDLQAFENVKEISGYLLVQSDHPGLKDLSFLRSLETVHGRNRVGKPHRAITINATPLLSLGLSSLKSIKHGPVVIMANRLLCYTYTINWDLLIEDRASQHIRISDNQDPKTCNATGHVCHAECTKDGCWGPGDHECLRCKNFQLGKRCLRTCSQERGLYEAGNKLCAFCDKECHQGCTGPSFNKDGECVPPCPPPLIYDWRNFKMVPKPGAKYTYDTLCKSGCPSGKYGIKVSLIFVFVSVSTTLHFCKTPAAFVFGQA